LDTTRISLLLRIRDLDNTKAWNEFDSIYRPVLRRYAHARGLGASESDDIAQECMLIVSRKIGSFDYDPQRGRFRNWLQVMAENRIRNFFRDRGAQASPTPSLGSVPADTPSPEAVFEQIWMQEHLHYCLRQLRRDVDAMTLEAFERYAIAEEPVESVCRALGLTPSQLYKIKWRLTQQLARRMNELLGPQQV
jgi:RNA polymerase sigma-70 factor (ECF subfamily)